MRVHTVAKGTMYPMPPLIKGEVDRVTQGGLPPEPYRSSTHKWVRASIKRVYTHHKTYTYTPRVELSKKKFG